MQVIWFISLFHVVPCCRFYLFLSSLVCFEYPFLKLCIFVHLMFFFLLSRYYSNSADLCFFLFIYVAILFTTWCVVLGLGSWGWHGNTVAFFLFLIWNVLRHLIPQNKIKYKLNKNTLHACGSGLTLWYSRKHFLENSWGDLRM